MSSSSKPSDSDSSSQLICNAGDSSDYDEEAPADQTMRGQAALVTAACPRQYHRTLEERRRANKLIPEDLSTEEALRQFRRVGNSCCTAQLLKATCHDEPHKRVRQSTNKRERHKHFAILADTTFAHKKLATQVAKKCGLQVSISRLKRFGGNLRYLMEAGKKPSTDLDLNPARQYSLHAVG
jgi:hypothetical protein